MPPVFCLKEAKKNRVARTAFGVMLAMWAGGGWVPATWFCVRFFCDIVTFIMALTKVSSTAHFVSRNAAVGGRGNAISGRWAPNTDVYVADDGLVVKVEMAGMKSDSLEITVEGNRLRVAGTRPDGCRAGKCNFLVMEISYGPFESVLELPPGYDLSRAKAVYLNGFLRIDVPVALRPHPKMTKVPIVGGN
jgi:HSP20 family protein